MENSKPRVCIIGAGPTGLVALKYLKDVADCTWYELKDQIGGLWVCNESDKSEISKNDKFKELYGHTHDSIYNDLTTIIPMHFFSFKDFPPKIGERFHFTKDEVFEYLVDYANHFDLQKYVIFNTSVTEIRRQPEGSESKHWKVSVSNQNNETEAEYFDYVVVWNGHNSIPYSPTNDFINFEKFKGKIMHAHDFKTPESEEFIGKNILFIGARWSGQDILYQFVDHKRVKQRISGEIESMTETHPENASLEHSSNFNKIIISSSGPESISKSENFKSLLEVGKICVRTSRKHEFTENSVIFEDGTEEQIDTVLICTGYRFSFPFIKDQELIQYDAEERYYGPLYQKIFSINDPSLMFAGQSDNNAFIQLVMQKQVLIIKYYISGLLSLPSKEDMLGNLNEDIESFKELGLRHFFKGNLSYQFGYMESLRNLLKSNDIAPFESNKNFFDSLINMAKIFGETILKGNFIDFKTYNYKKWLNSDFEFDTSDYF